MPKKEMLSTRLSADPEAKAKIMFNTHPEGYRLHRHNFFEFSFATDGECTHIINGQATHFRAGDICLLSPADLHQFIPLKDATPLTMYVLSFSPDPIRPEFWSHIPSQTFPIINHLDGTAYTSVLHAFEKMHARASKEKLPFDLVTQTAIEWIILNIAEPSEQAMSEEYMKIRPALIFIQNNFTEPITLADVAESAYFSREYFSALFHQCLGISFQDYLLNMRLEFSADLLALTDMTVTEICYQSGFRTLSYYIRAFTKKWGISPKTLRERNKAGLRE